MLTPLLSDDLLVPTDQDAQRARLSSQALAPLLSGLDAPSGDHSPPHVYLSANGTQATEFDLPLPVLRLLMGVLREVAAGNPVTLLPIPREMTTQQAADFLRVSRPSLIKLLDTGKVPYRKVGAHRRVRYEDALLYVKNERARRAKVMDELTAETERLGLS